MPLTLPPGEFAAAAGAHAALTSPVRHDGHDPALPCHPAGNGLCVLALESVVLVPWREALASEPTTS